MKATGFCCVFFFLSPKLKMLVAIFWALQQKATTMFVWVLSGSAVIPINQDYYVIFSGEHQSMAVLGADCWTSACLFLFFFPFLLSSSNGMTHLHVLSRARESPSFWHPCSLLISKGNHFRYHARTDADSEVERWQSLKSSNDMCSRVQWATALTFGTPVTVTTSASCGCRHIKLCHIESTVW